jgi:general secretion pathway protein N
MMPEILQRQPLAVVLAALAVALLVAIGFETGFGSRLGPSISAGISKPAAPIDAKLLPPLAAADPDQLYPEMGARPLFVPLRRPAPAAEQPGASTLKRGQFVLQGVAIAGDTKIALLREKSSGHIHRVEKGREINGMKLAEVSPESVTLAQGSESEVLPLQVLKPGAGSAAAQVGPFGPPGGGAPAANAGGAPTAASPNPLAPGARPTGSAPPQAQFGPMGVNPQAGAVPQATTAPLSPEELLARRRARRAQPSQ